MANEDRDIVFRRCICNYGTHPQIDTMIEEMSELTKALLKWRRAKGADSTAARDHIIDELADVRIMARQMEILFQAEDETERRINYKVQRQSKRLEEWEEKNGNTLLREMQKTISKDKTALYPMLDKIKKLQGKSNLCSDFIDFIRNKYVLFNRNIPREQPGYIGTGDYIDCNKLLAEFFGIDLEQAEEERQQILKSLHSQN